MDDRAILERLASLALELPPAPIPVASYVPAVRARDAVYVSGQIPLVDGEILFPGRLGAEVSIEQGREAARRCAMQALSALRAELGSFEPLTRLVKVTVFVASASGFSEQPQVANGASDLLAGVLGDAGTHAREAVGVAALPLHAPVEVSLIAQAG